MWAPNWAHTSCIHLLRILIIVALGTYFNYCKLESLSSPMAVKIASWMVVSVSIVGGGRIPTGVGWGVGL